MNYERIYNLIIKTRKLNPPDGYCESHHIIPKSLGGTNKSDNLVLLTAREHFICHHLLYKMHANTRHAYKMLYAFVMMCVCGSTNQTRIENSRIFEKYRIEFSKMQSKLQSGKGNSQYGTKWYHNIDLQISKKFKVCDNIPYGWIIGRVTNWDSYFKRICNKCGGYKESDSLTCRKCRRNRINSDDVDILELRDKYSKMYCDWKIYGYKQMCEIYSYTQSRPNLIKLMKNMSLHILNHLRIKK